MEDKGFATYSFLVQVTTDEHEIVNNFGYRVEEKFQENITRKIMKALAEHPHLTTINVDIVSMMGSAEDISEEGED